MTAARKRRRGFLPTREGLAILDARRREKGFTHESLAEAAKLNAEDQVRRLFNPQWGRGIQRDAIEKIAGVLELQPAEFIEDWLPKCRSSKQKQTVMHPTDIDWREVCLVMLEQQQKEQRIRRKATEQGFEVKVYVPLGLVERKQQQRRDGIVPMEKIHQLEEEVIIRTYQHDEFLNDVIGQKSPSKNKHIAIVGEPGAGKTTLLDAIATHIQKNTQDLPICISLGSLQGKKLKDYILEEWLPEAIALTYPDIDVETFHETSLQKRLRQGGVWLLLDGVDEMGETAPAKALESIRNQLTDWLGKVRVVLTCRTNVWDANLNNSITGFDTYKTQQFNQADIRRFIKQWFGFAGKPELGKILRQKLNEPQRDRIRKLVENPLRLALLCQVFHKDKQAELPETKAGLYELFVRYFYEWKPTQSSVDWTTQPRLQDELHQALGRLSIAGLDSDARFRLPKSLIKKEMDDRLFTLAWEIGWLNLVDREATTDEPVYAFFHPTFQEYFAALNIPSWDDFLPCDHNNNNPQPVDGKKYRIFEPQWNGVFSLWLERVNVAANDANDKEKFIEALIDFNDGIDLLKFYSLQSYDLARQGLGNFTGSKFHEIIATQYHYFEEGEEIVDYDRESYFDLYTSPPQTLHEDIINSSDSENFVKQFERLGTSLEEIISGERDLDGNINLIPSRETDGNKLNNEQGNLAQINDLNLLVKLLETENRWAVIQRLLKIADVQPKTVIDTLTKAIDYNRGNIYVNSSIAWILGVLALGDLESVKNLIRLIQNSKDYLTKWLAAQSIKAILIHKKPLIPKDVKQMKETVLNLKKLYGWSGIYEVLYYCAQNMSYPDFYDAWHKPTTTHPEAPDNIPVGNSTTQHLNFTQLPSILRSAIAEDRELNQAVKLICIDANQFSDQNNPAIDIYIEMIEQGCPEQQEEPSTMQQLKSYWRLRLKNLEKRITLLFYNSKADREFSETCLTALSTFGGAIAIITTQPCEKVKLISPNDPDLIDAVLKWLRRDVLEA